MVSILFAFSSAWSRLAKAQKLEPDNKNAILKDMDFLQDAVRRHATTICDDLAETAVAAQERALSWCEGHVAAESI